MKFYYIINIFELQLFDNDMTVLFKFFEICTEISFVSFFLYLFIYLFFHWKKYYNLIFDDTCKRYFCSRSIVLNSRSISKPFLNEGLSNMIFLFLLLSRFFVSSFIRMSNFVILNWQPLQYNAKFLKKGIVFPPHFYVWFFEKNSFHVMFDQLIKFHCLIAFASWAIRQYVYYNSMFPRLRHQKFWN